MTALRALSSMTICSQPETQGLPMPRATTAACEVLPPRLVRMPCAWKKPWMSSGLVSSRTRMTFSPALPARFGGVGVEHDLAGGGAGRSRQALRQRLAAEIRRQLRHQQLLQHGRFDAQQGALLGDQPFLGTSPPNCAPCRAVHLAVARLQAIERAFFDGEFEILDFVVMRLQPVVQLHQLAVDFRHFLFHLGDRLGRADARHHVLALRIDQVFAVDHVLAGAGIAREAHAGTRIAAHVAEHHGADADRGAIGLVLGDL